MVHGVGSALATSLALDDRLLTGSARRVVLWDLEELARVVQKHGTAERYADGVEVDGRALGWAALEALGEHRDRRDAYHASSFAAHVVALPAPRALALDRASVWALGDPNSLVVASGG